MAVGSLGVVASFAGAVSGPTTLTLPVLQNIPQTTPGGGASFVVFYVMGYSSAADLSSGNLAGVSDDAPMDPLYNTCYYSDGLNHYGLMGQRQTPYNVTVGFTTNPIMAPQFTASGGGMGAILFNPLTTANNFLVTVSGLDYFECFALAYTGLNQTNPRAQDFPPSFWHVDYGTGGWYAPYEATTGPGAGHQFGWNAWSYNDQTAGHPGHPGPPYQTIGPPSLWVPGPTRLSPATYPDYQDDGPGELAVYSLVDVNHGAAWAAYPDPTFYGDFEATSSGGWSWGDGTIGTIMEVDDSVAASGFLFSYLVAEQTLGSFPVVGQDLTGSWSGMLASRTWGAAVTLVGGPGPPLCGEPPTGGIPVFHNHFRAVD